MDQVSEEVQALRKQRALEEKLSNEEKEEILRTIERECLPQVPSSLRKAVIQGLRKLPNDHLYELTQRPVEFAKFLFLEIQIQEHQVSAGEDEDAQIQAEVTNCLVLAQKRPHSSDQGSSSRGKHKRIKAVRNSGNPNEDGDEFSSGLISSQIPEARCCMCL